MDLDRGVDAGRDIRIGVGPLARGLDRFELGHDQTAGETGRSRVLRIDGRQRPGQHQATFVAQRLQALQVGRTRSLTTRQRVGGIAPEDEIQHAGLFPEAKGGHDSRPVSRRIEIHPTHPQPRLVEQAVQALKRGDLLLLPSDAAYLMAWALDARDAEARVVRLRALDIRHPFTLLCDSLSAVGSLAKLDDRAFRLVKSLIPAPCTFILPAAAELPKRLKQAKRRAVGVRVPDHAVLLAVLAAYAEPILATSLLLPDEELPNHEAELVAERMLRHVDLMLDSGDCPPGPTTIIDCLGDEPAVTREGFAPLTLR